MKQRITFLLEYFVLWWAYFISARTLFLAYLHENCSNIDLSELLKTFIYGTRLDLSVAAYVCIIPFLILMFSTLKKNAESINRYLRFYSIFCIVILSIIITLDPEFYAHWGFRIDASPLLSFLNPSELWIEISKSPIFILLIIFACFVAFWSYLFSNIIKENASEWVDINIYKWLIINVLAVIILILPMRGGFQTESINQSVVYFSKNPFLNHAALNVTWNFVYSLLYSRFSENNPYQYYSNQTAFEVKNELFSSQKTDIWLVDTIKNKPNIILITWEGFTPKVVQKLGGKANITPNMDSLCKEGVLFSNIFAAGDNAEKGIIGLLSGLPSLPQNNWLNDASKSADCRSFARVYDLMSYRTALYCGGNMENNNFKNYLQTLDFQSIVQKNDFEEKDCTTKNGVYDHVLFSKSLRDMSLLRTPFFVNIQTSSSQEPYQVPKNLSRKDYTKLNDETELMLNSMNYTDNCIGDFIAKAKNQAWWNNTIVIITSNQGNRLPTSNNRFDDFRIPVLMFGGAMQQRGVEISTVGSQNDLLFTLLSQYHQEKKGFEWSKNLLSSKTKQSAYFAFQNGFGYVEPFGSLLYDALSNEIVQQNGIMNDERIKRAKILAQESYNLFLKK